MIEKVSKPRNGPQGRPTIIFELTHRHTCSMVGCFNVSASGTHRSSVGETGIVDRTEFGLGLYNRDWDRTTMATFARESHLNAFESKAYLCCGPNPVPVG